MGLMLKSKADPRLWELLDASPAHYESLNLQNYIIYNLLPVSIGNIIGGAVFVGLAYWFIYLRKPKSK